MKLPQPDAAFHWRREAWGAALRCRAIDEYTQHLFTSKQLALPGEDGWRQAAASVGATPRQLMRVKQVQNGHWVVVWPKEVTAGGAKLLAP